jgi:D-alanine-D-alanine ligase-like ATP-grasp enzyme
MPVSVQASWQTSRHTSCPDCGDAPVNHFVEKMSAAMEEMALPFSLRFFSFIPIFSLFSNFFFLNNSNRAVPNIFKCLAVVRLGTIVHEPDTQTGDRARCIWIEAMRRNIDMWEFRPFGISREMFVAEIGSKTIVFDGLPRPSTTLSGKKGLPASLAWVDNKPVLKKKLANSATSTTAGIPVARGGTAFTWKKAKKIFGQLKQSRGSEQSEQSQQCQNVNVIVKPSTGSRSRHTSTHVSDEKGLRLAFIKAKKLSPWVIIEEELIGHVYRGTIIGGKVIGIRRKDPPQVVGDGLHNVRELIEIENRRPERQGPVYGKIKTGAENFQLENGIDFSSIPKKNQIVILSKKTSIGSGGGSTDVTDSAHPDIIALLERIAIVLDDQLVGVDFIVPDISRPLSLSEENRLGVIECNSLPFIHVHLFPLNGKPRDTARALWNAVLKRNTL